MLSVQNRSHNKTYLKDRFSWKISKYLLIGKSSRNNTEGRVKPPLWLFNTIPFQKENSLAFYLTQALKLVWQNLYSQTVAYR